MRFKPVWLNFPESGRKSVLKCGHLNETFSVRFTTIFFNKKFANRVRNTFDIFFLTFLKQKHVMVVQFVEFYEIPLYLWHTSFMNL